LTVQLVGCFRSVILVLECHKCIALPSVVSVGYSAEPLKLGLKLRVAGALVDTIHEQFAALLCIGCHGDDTMVSLQQE